MICPAAIRKQWALELEEKFSLPALVLDPKSFREARREARDPLNAGAILIISLHHANAIRDDLRAVKWDLVVIDEAHKLKNAYRPSNKVGQGIEQRLGDPNVTLESYIVANTHSHVMEKQWGIPKSEMERRHILFQEEDKDAE